MTKQATYQNLNQKLQNHIQAFACRLGLVPTRAQVAALATVIEQEYFLNSMTVKEAAAHLGVSEKTIYRRIHRKTLRAFPTDHGAKRKRWRIPAGNLAAMLHN